MRLRTLSTTAMAAVIATSASTAWSVTLDISGISGVWQNAVPTVNVIDADSIRWGNPFGQPNQSGYDFDPAATPFTATADTSFNLGTFTHLNFPITGTSLDTVDLEVTVSILNGPTVTSVFSFDHWETSNNANPCANPSADNSNGCADRVIATLNLGASDTFTIDNVDYVFNITAFQVGNSDLSEFWTKEGAANSAVLRAEFTAKENINPIPLPAAGWMLIAGLGGMAAMRKFKRAA